MRKYLFIFLSIFAFLQFYSNVFAQTDSLGVAIPMEVNSDTVEEGHIICAKEGGAVICDTGYDTSMVGVVSSNPAVSFRHEDDEDLPLVINSGNALVKVTSANGNIEVGDFITSSEVPGVGQKATLNGYIVGSALEPYSSDDPEVIGDVYVAINIIPFTSSAVSRSNIIASLRQSLSAPVISPLATFRYLLAFLIVLISFALGFIYFGRVAKTGVEAIGRNPLAKNAIQLAVLINVIVTVLIILTGIAIALLILIL